MGALLPDVFHLALASEFSLASEFYDRSTLGLSVAEVGFMHLSFAWQVMGVAQAFYSDVSEPLLLLRINSSGLSLVIEPAGGAGSEQFPHLYGPLPVSAVLEARPFVVVDGMPADWAVS